MRGGNQAPAPRKKLFLGLKVVFTLGGNAADVFITCFCNFHVSFAGANDTWKCRKCTFCSYDTFKFQTLVHNLKFKKKQKNRKADGVLEMGKKSFTLFRGFIRVHLGVKTVSHVS